MSLTMISFRAKQQVIDTFNHFCDINGYSRGEGFEKLVLEMNKNHNSSIDISKSSFISYLQKCFQDYGGNFVKINNCYSNQDYVLGITYRKLSTNESECIRVGSSLVTRLTTFAEENDKIPILAFLCQRPEKSPIYGVFDISKLKDIYPNSKKRNSNITAFRNNSDNSLLIHVRTSDQADINTLCCEMFPEILALNITKWLKTRRKTMKLYNEYQYCLKKLGSEYLALGADITCAKKLRGALFIEVLRKELNHYFSINSLPIKATQANSYIIGSKYEYDLLIVKDTAEAVYGIAYSPKDIVAIIESKAGGLFNIDHETDSISQAFNQAYSLNKEINFGYITISENRPKNLIKKDGTPTINHWDLTQKYLIKKVNGPISIYSITLHQGKKLIDTGNDDEFYQFIDFLVTH